MELRVLAQPTTGYMLTYSQDSSAGSHEFCGASDVVCPNCDKPLLRLVSFDTSDARLELDSSPSLRLDLLFCWTCPLSKGFTYRYDSQGGIELLEFERGPIEIDFPYEDHPQSFPVGSCALAPIDEATESLHVLHNAAGDQTDIPDAVEELLDKLQPSHQVGGQPVLMQPDMVVRNCLICDEPMPLFATIADDCLDSRGFTGNPYVLTTFNLCRRCNCIAASQQCD